VVAGVALQSFYFAHRYEYYPQPRTDRWASTVHHARIAVSGLTLHYPLYGADLTNSVEFVGSHGSHDSYSGAANCPTWRRLINGGGFNYVVTAEDLTKAGVAPSSPATWTSSDPEAKLVVRDVTLDPIGFQLVEVFALHGTLDPGTCPLKRT
jgi:hypothetical protein